MITKKSKPAYAAMLGLTLCLQGCSGLSLFGPTDELPQASPGAEIPASFPVGSEAGSSAGVAWREFFTDPRLIALIDSALQSNQELKVLMQEIEVARNEVSAREGEYLPFVNLRAGAGVDKVGRATREGAVEENLEIEPGREFPEPLPDFLVSAEVSWEVDIWKKLRNAKKAAVLRYLATREGRNFMVTHLVAEIANAYYELTALDNRLAILNKTIEIQESALETVKLQKAAAKATELAVRKFEAEVLKNRSRLYEIRQQITETENRLNYLVGRYPQPIERSARGFEELALPVVHVGDPAELLGNRPDIHQAELELAAAELDVKVARARFYPSLDLSAAIGLQTFDAGAIASTPESLIYRVAADLLVPLFNKKAIRAAYRSANAQQLQALYKYRQTVLKAYLEVLNQLAKIDNLEQSYAMKRKQVEAMSESIAIAARLFKSARADYMEVLMTQRDALESRMELVELKQQQVNARVTTYQALGGGYTNDTDGNG